MKHLMRVLALTLVLCLACGSGLAASKPKATATPAPQEIVTAIQEPPAQIRKFLDIAYNEWETLAGKSLKKVNKYTEWRGKGIGFGWCGGFVTWCMMEAGIPMATLEATKAQGEGPIDGLFHVKEASVGKLMRGYMVHFRTTHVPQPGFLLVYGESYNRTIHIGLVYEVEELGGGKYRLTTIEGNMSNRVKMYIHDYDMNAAKWEKNLTVVPKEERTLEEKPYFSYKKQGEKWYVNCFLMPWVPGDMTLVYDEPVNNETDLDLVTVTPPPAG